MIFKLSVNLKKLFLNLVLLQQCPELMTYYSQLQHAQLTSVCVAKWEEHDIAYSSVTWNEKSTGRLYSFY